MAVPESPKNSQSKQSSSSPISSPFTEMVLNAPTLRAIQSNPSWHFVTSYNSTQLADSIPEFRIQGLSWGVYYDVTDNTRTKEGMTDFNIIGRPGWRVRGNDKRWMYPATLRGYIPFKVNLMVNTTL